MYTPAVVIVAFAYIHTVMIIVVFAYAGVSGLAAHLLEHLLIPLLVLRIDPGKKILEGWPH